MGFILAIVVLGYWLHLFKTLWTAVSQGEPLPQQHFLSDSQERSMLLEQEW